MAGLLRALADRGAAPAQLALLAAGFLASCVVQYPACSELAWQFGTGLCLHSIFVSGPSHKMTDWLSQLEQLDIPDGAVAGLSNADKPIIEGKLLQLSAGDRPLFFRGQQIDVLKRLRTLLPDMPAGMTTAFADHPLQKLSSNIEVQTHAVLKLGKAVNSMASSFRAAKSAQFVYTPSNASSMQDPNFKLELIKAYQRSSYDQDEDKPCKTCKCMLLDVTLPTSYVTGSHLFKFKWHMAVQEVLGFSCINDTRNGLLLAKPIEEAFDAGFLCFIHGEDGEHRVHLLDARLCSVKLTDMKAYPWLKPPGQEKMAKESKQQDIMKDVTQALKESFGDIPTFADLQGKQLQFEGDQRPFKRCLAFQASQSRHSALSHGRISPSAIPEIDARAWTDNSYLERIKDYLADPEFQYQVGPIDRLESISEVAQSHDFG